MTYQEHFPDYPAGEFPALPQGFVDSTWRNDLSPSMTNQALGLRIWCDYPSRDQREFSDSPRFILVHEQGDAISADIAQSESWEDILSALEELAL
jgi:hypothetical protein